MTLSKTYLKSVSTDELLQLAEIYGVYVPKGLNRNFIIEELLDIEDGNKDGDSDFSNAPQGKKGHQKYDTKKIAKRIKLFHGLPASYNTTEIHILLRDPMWLFVFWDFYRPDFKTIITDFGFGSFILRVMLFHKNNLSEPYDYYDIDISEKDKSRYIFLSFDDIVTRVNLCVRSIDDNITVLAESNFVYLNRKNIPNNLCVSENTANTAATLSGLSLLKKSHFKNYRQAFRNRNENGEG